MASHAVRTVDPSSLRYLAARLRMAGWATLRLDLLIDGEREVDADTGVVRFDVRRLASRLHAACTWAVQQEVPGVAPTVLFGASTGAAAAALVASDRPDLVRAVMARGGRMDLAEDALDRVHAPVLMVVGGADPQTLALNRAAARRLPGRSHLSVVRGAGHTFEEPGTLGEAGERVVDWLARESRPSLLSRCRVALTRWIPSASGARPARVPP